MSVPAQTSSPDQPDTRVRAALARETGTRPQDWWLVSKARHALTVVLGALEPGEVITQPMTCLTAVAPIPSAGHEPRYADLDPATLALDPASVQGLVGERTRAVVGQHSFGAAAPLRRLRDALPSEVLLVEDSAHCVAELARDAEGAPVADVSVHSFGVEKVLPTRAGAAVWVDPAGAAMPWHTRVVGALAALGEAGVTGAVSQALSRPAQGLARRLGPAGRIGLALGARAGVVDTPIMPSELEGRIAGTPTRMGATALREVEDALAGLAVNRAHRRSVAAIYRDGLAGVDGLQTPAALRGDGLTLVRYPILLRSGERAERAFDALQDAGLVPGRWYRPLLFPGPTDAVPFGYQPGTSPRAEDVSARLLNLPTAAFVTEEMARRAVDIVRAHA